MRNYNEMNTIDVSNPSSRASAGHLLQYGRRTD